MEDVQYYSIVRTAYDNSGPFEVLYVHKESDTKIVLKTTVETHVHVMIQLIYERIFWKDRAGFPI